jgi:hypothetical protein
MRSQFGVRNGIRAGKAASRSPLRLAGLSIAAGLVLLGALAFVRAILQAAFGQSDSALWPPQRT